MPVEIVSDKKAKNTDKKWVSSSWSKQTYWLLKLDLGSPDSLVMLWGGNNWKTSGK